MDVSIVIPVYNEVGGLPILRSAIDRVLNPLPISAEVIFADDGSQDGSGDLLDEFAKQDPRITVLHLRRNYGQTAAIMAGIQHSVGDIIVSMDADGQNDPSDIPRLLDKVAEGFDVVSGWRQNREDKALQRRLPSAIANWLISTVMGLPLHDYGCTLKAYRREVIEDVRLYGEMHRFIPIYVFWEGARVTELPVKHHPRQHGTSKYGLGRVTRVVLDLLILVFIDRAFDRPIQFFGKFGLIALFISVLTFGWALALKYGSGVSLIQTPLPLLSATIGLSGVMFLLLGVIAEVLARTYFESRGIPPYKIKSVTRHPSAPARTSSINRW